ncbi:MAG: hypothetical protein ABJA70_23515, partial [Chryseolinea sp.]
RWLLPWRDIKMAMLSMTISGQCPALLGYYHFNKLIPVKQIDVYAEEVLHFENDQFHTPIMPISTIVRKNCTSQ